MRGVLIAGVFSVVYIATGIILEYVFEIKEPVVYASIFCVYGFVGGILL